MLAFVCFFVKRRKLEEECRRGKFDERTGKFADKCYVWKKRKRAWRQPVSRFVRRNLKDLRMRFRTERIWTGCLLWHDETSCFFLRVFHRILFRDVSRWFLENVVRLYFWINIKMSKHRKFTLRRFLQFLIYLVWMIKLNCEVQLSYYRSS